MARVRLVLALLKVVTLVGCAASESPTVRCGPATTIVGPECQAEVVSPIVCGAGTTLKDSQCILSATCGPGTLPRGARCVPSSLSATCNAGTALEAGQCVAPSAVTCGPGTALSGNRCVTLSTPGDGGLFIARMPSKTVTSNGYSQFPVFAMGILPDGGTSTEPVVLTVSPASAGTVEPAEFSLDALGTTAWFTPCRSSLPDCLGSFQVTLARASAPSDILATTGTIALVPSPPVASVTPCLGDASVVFIDGEPGNDIYLGRTTVVPPHWVVAADADEVWLDALLEDVNQPATGTWEFEFTTRELSQPLSVNVYADAQRAYLNAPYRPGLDVNNDIGCNTLTGAFQIHKITWSGRVLTEILVSFEQRCETSAGWLRGCVHFRR